MVWVYTASVRTVSVAGVESLIAAGDTVILDVRTPEEYAAGRISQNAVNCHHTELELCAERIPLPKNVPIVVYCTSGVRSFAAIQRLKKLGYRDVREFDGGTDAWVSRGRTLVTE